MKLTRKLNGVPNGTQTGSATKGSHSLLGSSVNRRTFLRNSGITAGGAALAVAAGPSMLKNCLLYTSPSPRDRQKSRMPSSA